MKDFITERYADVKANLLGFESAEAYIAWKEQKDKELTEMEKSLEKNGKD